MTYRQVFPIWWSITWRSILAGLLAGAVCGFISGVFIGLVGYGDKARLAAGISGWIAGLIGNLWATRQGLIAHKIFLSS